MIKYPLENKVINLTPASTNLLNKIVNENNTKMFKDYRQIMNKINDNGFLVIKKYPVRLIFGKKGLLITKTAIVNQDNASGFTMTDYFKQVLKQEVYKRVIETCNIIIHGMSVEMEMPFMFYYLNFSYWDNFLYVSFVEKK